MPCGSCSQLCAKLSSGRTWARPGTPEGRSRCGSSEEHRVSLDINNQIDFWVGGSPWFLEALRWRLSWHLPGLRRESPRGEMGQVRQPLYSPSVSQTACHQPLGHPGSVTLTSCWWDFWAAPCSCSEWPEGLIGVSWVLKGLGPLCWRPLTVTGGMSSAETL